MGEADCTRCAVRLTACALRRRPTTLLFEKGREDGGTEGRRGNGWNGAGRVWVAAPTVAAIPEAPASASAARHESTEDETREKERPREGQEKRDTEKEKRREGREERDSAKGRRRDDRTSKIGRRRKRRAEKREGRKEGRTRASRRSGRRTHRSQAGQARNLSLSPSFSFDPRPRFLRAPRASQPLFLFLFRLPARSPLLITLHGPPPEPPLHSSRHREPRPTTFSLALIHPS